ncbi:MAG: DNA-processing protein DprA [Sulfurisoma sp.]|nr:DNA-processing protein DprA [Sulfurisoma sp.]
MPDPSADLADWVRLTAIPGVGGETQRHLLKAFGLPGSVFAASGSAVRGVIGAALAERLASHDATAEIEAALAWAAEPGNRIVTLADSDYPQALLATVDPPALLYVKGRAELLNRPAVAIVGSRNATKQGEANAEAFAATLSAAGLTVVSGLALGIDAAAHRGALGGAGSTLAFIGTGADRIYPASNEPLTREIAGKGCIVSEFPLGMAALPGNFPRRNRLIAGVSLGCLVVEAAERSGSLITARLALDAGREVFAIPGSIHSPLAKGCHKLIKQGAKLVEKAEDILEELRWERPPSSRSDQSVALSPKEGDGGRGRSNAMTEDGEGPILAVLGHDPCSLDTLAARSGLTPAHLLAMLLPLELEGRVAQLPGGLYQRLSRGQGSN